MMLEARDISFGYPGQPNLFEHLSLQVDRGERLRVKAPSGIGKTTLCHLLTGYLSPRSGEIYYDGKPLPGVGVCPVQLIGQHPERALDPRMRMADSLAEAGEPTPELLEGLGIQDRWLTRYPHELSGGELQRFCIARALSVNPSYVIADEISTMLDAVTQALIWQFLLEDCQKNNRGLIFVTHSDALAKRLQTRELLLTDKISTK